MLTTLIIWKIKESSTHLSRALGQETKDKQIGINDELKKINDLTMVQRFRITTLIARENTKLNVFVILVMRKRKHWLNFFLVVTF